MITTPKRRESSQSAEVTAKDSAPCGKAFTERGISILGSGSRSGKRSSCLAGATVSHA